MKKNEVKVKRTMNAEAVGVLLSDLVNSFKQGTVCIQEGPAFVTLKPVSEMEVEIVAADKKGKQKIEIELSWKEATPIQEEGGETAVRISAEEPEFTAPLPDEGESDPE
jgi:amphi-Trp domain-containing protein